jgi:hypothetical protein
MVSDWQGEEYKPMTNGVHLYVEDCDAIYKRALEGGATSIWNQRINFTMIEVQVWTTSLVIDGGLLLTKKIRQKKKLPDGWTTPWNIINQNRISIRKDEDIINSPKIKR